LKIIDKYILRKFLGTFFYAITVIITIAIIFDISEKMDDFLEKRAPLKAIVVDYYFNFIPFFVNMFSPLFTFISVIFFTSRMAFNTEIIAILTGGISFRRMLVPYMIGATVLTGISYTLNHYVIPHANEKRLHFENTYIRNKYRISSVNIHRQMKPGEFVYAEDFNNFENIASRFTIEKFKDGKLIVKLTAMTARFDSTKGSWIMDNWFERRINGMNESIRSGSKMDTVIALRPSDFGTRINNVQTMNKTELDHYIESEKLKGNDEVPYFELEKHQRTSMPFSTYILTLIGVSLASRKVRGGIGLHIGFGLFLSFTYIMFLQVSSTFATNGNLSPWLAVWIPNFIFLGIALYLLRTAPK
jgi:lipopolysaccharide export system permease protein